jgi:uncharacterized protein
MAIRSARLLATAALSLAVLALPGHAADRATRAFAQYPSGRVTITGHDRAGWRHDFQVWVADSPERQERGLMFVKRMAPDRGMLFPMTPPHATAFWMKNCVLSLDIIFIAPDGRIMRIAERTEPQSLQTIPSMGIAGSVLELNAGTAQKLDLEPGDTVTFVAISAH